MAASARVRSSSSCSPFTSSTPAFSPHATPELLAISKNASSLCSGIINILSVPTFSVKLEQGGFVTSTARSNIMRTTGVTPEEKCILLLDSVKERVRTDAKMFDSFVEIFSCEAALSDYAEYMTSTRETEIQKSTPTSPDSVEESPPVQVSKEESAHKYATMMADLVSILEKSSTAVSRMRTYLTHYAQDIRNEDYISVTQTREFKEAAMVETLFSQLAPYLNSPDCFLLEKLVHVAKCDMAMQRLKDYMNGTDNVALSLSNEHHCESETHVSATVTTREMSRGRLRRLQSRISGIFRVPRNSLQYEGAGPGSVTISWTTSRTILLHMQSVALDDGDLTLLARENVRSIQLGEKQILVGNRNNDHASITAKMDTAVDPLQKRQQRLSRSVECLIQSTTVNVMPRLERSSSWPLDHHHDRRKLTADDTRSELKRSESLPLELMRTLWSYLARRVSTDKDKKDNSKQKSGLEPPKPKLPALTRRKRVYRRHSLEYASRPRTYAMRVSDEDGHRSVLRRQQSVCISYTDDLNQLQDQPESLHASGPRAYAMRLNDEKYRGRNLRQLRSGHVSCTRSMDDFQQLEPETEFRRQRSVRSLYSLSSEEDLWKEIRYKDSPGAELQRTRRMLAQGGNSGLNRAFRSLDDLDKSSTGQDSEFMRHEKIHSALSSKEDLPHENSFEEKSSSNQFPINTNSDLESYGDELDEDPCQQTKKYAFGPIELVVGHNIPTCKCVPKATCFHRNSWRGLITKDWSMKLFQSESRDTEINFLPSSNPLSENAMERVKKMVPGETVFTEPL